MTSLAEYWTPNIIEKYVDKKITLICTDSFNFNKVNDDTYELRTTTFYNLDDFGITFNSYDKRKRNYPFSSEEFKKIENKKSFCIEGHLFNFENNSFVCKEEIEFDVNLIRHSKFINELIDEDIDLSEKLPINVSPKVMKIIKEYLEYFIQPFHKIYEIKKQFRYNIFKMNINDYDNSELGTPEKKKEVQEWYNNFVNKLSRFEKEDIINKTHYLQIEHMFHLFLLEYTMWFKSIERQELIEFYNIPEEDQKKSLEEAETIIQEEKKKFEEEQKKLKEKEKENQEKEND